MRTRSVLSSVIAVVLVAPTGVHAEAPERTGTYDPILRKETSCRRAEMPIFACRARGERLELCAAVDEESRPTSLRLNHRRRTIFRGPIAAFRLSVETAPFGGQLIALSFATKRVAYRLVNDGLEFQSGLDVVDLQRGVRKRWACDQILGGELEKLRSDRLRTDVVSEPMPGEMLSNLLHGAEPETPLRRSELAEATEACRTEDVDREDDDTNTGVLVVRGRIGDRCRTYFDGEDAVGLPWFDFSTKRARCSLIVDCGLGRVTRTIVDLRERPAVIDVGRRPSRPTCNLPKTDFATTPSHSENDYELLRAYLETTRDVKARQRCLGRLFADIRQRPKTWAGQPDFDTAATFPWSALRKHGSEAVRAWAHLLDAARASATGMPEVRGSAGPLASSLLASPTRMALKLLRDPEYGVRLPLVRDASGLRWADDVGDDHPRIVRVQRWRDFDLVVVSRAEEPTAHFGAQYEHLWVVDARTQRLKLDVPTSIRQGTYFASLGTSHCQNKANVDVSPTRVRLRLEDHEAVCHPPLAAGVLLDAGWPGWSN